MRNSDLSTPTGSYSIARGHGRFGCNPGSPSAINVRAPTGRNNRRTYFAPLGLEDHLSYEPRVAAENAFTLGY